MMSGIVGSAVDAMTELGARSIRAAVGPSVCGRCYEVPEAMRAQAQQASPMGHNGGPPMEQMPPMPPQQPGMMQ